MTVKPITADVIRAIHRNLKEFGYNNLTYETVKADKEMG